MASIIAPFLLAFVSDAYGNTTEQTFDPLGPLTGNGVARFGDISQPEYQQCVASFSRTTSLSTVPVAKQKSTTKLSLRRPFEAVIFGEDALCVNDGFVEVRMSTAATPDQKISMYRSLISMLETAAARELIVTGRSVY